MDKCGYARFYEKIGNVSKEVEIRACYAEKLHDYSCEEKSKRCAESEKSGDFYCIEYYCCQEDLCNGAIAPHLASRVKFNLIALIILTIAFCAIYLQL